MQKFSLQTDGNVVAHHYGAFLQNEQHHHRSTLSRNKGILIAGVILLLIVSGSFFALLLGRQSNKISGAMAQSHAPIVLSTANHPTATQSSSSGIYVAMETYLYKLDKTGKTKLWEHEIKGLGSSIAVTHNVVYAYSISNEANLVSYVYAFRATDGHALWKVAMTPNEVLDMSNLVVDNQNLYVFSVDGSIHAFNAINGRQRWVYATHSAYYNTQVRMSVASNILYISSGRQFYAFHTANGHLFWMKSVGINDGFFSAARIVNGVVYVALTKENVPGENPSISTLYAWTTSGNLHWRSQQINDFIPDAAAIGDNQLYVTGETRIYALNIANGRISWQRFVGTTDLARPLFDHDTLYLSLEGPYQCSFPSCTNTTHITSAIALKAWDGSLIWQKQYSWSPPSIQAIANGILYMDQVYTNGHVYAISTANHATLWSYMHPIPDALRPQGAGNSLIVILN